MFGRLVRIIMALAAAVTAAMLFVILAGLGEPTLRDLAARLALSVLDAMVGESLATGDVGGSVAALAGLYTLAVGMLAGPPLAVAVVGEACGWRMIRRSGNHFVEKIMRRFIRLDASSDPSGSDDALALVCLVCRRDGGLDRGRAMARAQPVAIGQRSRVPADAVAVPHRRGVGFRLLGAGRPAGRQVQRDCVARILMAKAPNMVAKL
jgi:hypothetical protein